MSMVNLGGIYLDSGRYEESEAVYRDLLILHRSSLGDDHPETLATMGNLAQVLAKRGETDEAEQRFRETLEAQARVLGPANPDRILILINLADMYRENGRAADARPLYAEARAVYADRFGDDHRATLEVGYKLTRALALIGQSDQAIVLLSELVRNGFPGESFASERELDSLRNEPDFLALLEDGGAVQRD